MIGTDMTTWKAQHQQQQIANKLRRYDIVFTNKLMVDY